MSTSLLEETIERKIYLIRGKKVLLDIDLAKLYSVATFRLNEAVKRNKNRFPSDFMFQLSAKEKAEVIANCDNLAILKYSPHTPYAFTEQGVAMLSSVLNSERAVRVNIQIMRTFTKLRELLATHEDLRQKIEAIERGFSKKFSDHDHQFEAVFDAIKRLVEPVVKKRKRLIGFHP